MFCNKLRAKCAKFYCDFLGNVQAQDVKCKKTFVFPCRVWYNGKTRKGKTWTRLRICGRRTENIWTKQKRTERNRPRAAADRSVPHPTDPPKRRSQTKRKGPLLHLSARKKKVRLRQSGTLPHARARRRQPKRPPKTATRHGAPRRGKQDLPTKARHAAQKHQTRMRQRHTRQKHRTRIRRHRKAWNRSCGKNWKSRNRPPPPRRMRRT